MAVGTSDLKFRILASVVGAQAIDQLRGQLNSVSGAAKSLSSGLKIAAGFYAAEKVIAYGDSLVNAGDKLQKLSEKTGISVSELAKFQVGAELADLSVETLAKNMNKLGVAVVKASSGSAEYSSIFKALGINIRDSSGNLKNSGEITEELADKFSVMSDGAAKATVATKLFGKAGFELIPFLNQGRDGIKQFALAIDSDFASKSELLHDTLKLVSVGIQNLGINSLRGGISAFQDIAQAFLDFSKNGEDVADIMKVIGEGARLLAVITINAFSGVATIIDTTKTLFKELNAIVHGDLEAGRKIDAEYEARGKARDKRNAELRASLLKNSLVFGEGSTADIEKRQQDAADANAKKKRTGTIDVTALGENAKVLRSFDERIEKIKAETAAVGQSNVQKQAGVLIAELASKGIDKSGASYKEYAAKITAAVTALNAAQEKQTSADFLRKENQANDLALVSIQNYGLQSYELEKLVQAKELDNQATEATRNFTDEGRKAYLDATDAVKAQKAALVDLQTEQKRSYGVGAKQALRDYLEAARDVAAQTKAAFTQAFSNIEDSLVDFVKTGKLNFQKFADDIVDQLIRISIKALAVQAITGGQSLFGNLFGSSSSNAVTSASSSAGNDFSGALGSYTFAKGGILNGKGEAQLVKRYSAGGIATRPQLAVFGEGSGPEAYVPLPDGRTIPVSMKNVGQSNTVGITVNLGDGTGSMKASSEQGRQLGVLIQSAVQQELVNARRPGGILAS